MEEGREAFEPVVYDYDQEIHFDPGRGDRGMGRRLYGERHKFDERSYTLHPDDMQIGVDEPTNGSGEEFMAEMDTEDMLRRVVQGNADNAGVHIRVYSRRMNDDVLQGARDMVHNHRIQQIRNLNVQLDLRRRNQGN